MNIGPLLFLVAMIALLWVFLIRPQRRRVAAQQALIADLQAGAEVVTAGGLMGVVRAIADDYVILEIAPGTEVRIAKQAISGIVPNDG